MARRLRLLTVITIVVATVLAVAACGGRTGGQAGDNQQGAPSKPVHLKIASFDMGTSTYVAGQGIAQVILDYLPQGSTVDVLPYSGQVGNPKLVSGGEAELGLGFTVSNRWAFAGQEVYDRKMDNLRALSGGFGRYFVTVITTKKSPVTSLREALSKGKIVLLTDPVGSQGAVVARHIVEAYGSSFDKIKAAGGRVEHISQEVAVQRLQDGQADLWIKLGTVGHPKISELAASTPVQFLAVDDDVRQRLAAQYGYEIDKPLPAGSFKGQDKDVPSISFLNVLFTNKDLPDDLAYLITKAMAENKDRLVKIHALFKDYEPEVSGTLLKTGLPLHPGAEKYYREKGWSL